VRFAVPTRCFFREVSPGRFEEEHDKVVVTPENYPTILKDCSTAGAQIVGDRALRRQSHEAVLALLRETLLAAGEPRYTHP